MTKKTLLIALALTGLAACAPGGSVQRDAFYRLAVPAPSQAQIQAGQPILPGVVEVQRPAAEGLAVDRAIVYSYRDRPQEVDHYSYHFWTEPPAVLVQDQLVEFLRAAKAAERVVTSELRVPPQWVVQSRIKRFEQLAGSEPAVVIEMEMGVTRLRGNELTFLKTYRVETPMRGDNVPAAVNAFDAALADLFRQFLADLPQAAKA